MKRGTPSSTEGAMNNVSFLAQQGLPNNGSGVQGFVNGDKRPGAEMEGSGFTQFTSQLEIDEAEPEREELSDDSEALSPNAKKAKKTKGRVKIKMEFIENKLRRYTTFSKRKTGIMKKVLPCCFFNIGQLKSELQ